ncbi:uncharacterized protein LOC142328733 [Lycorma delicatula]|uniref:uncharacterized protein LOC142328733 n=1 Tax=Lycorma delicatula TaxID=130591 RepID=UPI003F510DEF
MTDLLIQNSPPRSEQFRGCGLMEGCRSPIVPRYSGFEERPPGLGLCDLKHSKSDDLVLQSAPVSAPEMHHGISDVAIQIQKEACVVYEDDLIPAPPSSSSNHYGYNSAVVNNNTSGNSKCLPVYYSDSETYSEHNKCSSNSSSPSNSYPPHIPLVDKSVLKITGDFGPDVPIQSRRSSQHIGLYDRLDPEDSIRDIISENDFYRFVLFKRHYEKYLDISQKYEEARNIAYYLEEKYHEIKAERDRLANFQRDLEKKLESKDQEMHDKEEELFLQLEKAIRLEEDCEKIREEKERMGEWKDKLEREKNEAYRQLKLQAEESEITRRRLERARNDVVRQVTAIVAEKDSLERENERLKEALRDIERKSYRRSAYRRSNTNLQGLEKEVCDLKLVAKQSATLNSQLKKGMKHLAMCRRRKCSVCSYTRATFGEYASDGSRGKLFSCFQAPFGEIRKRGRSTHAVASTSGNFHLYSETDMLAERLSEMSLPTPPSPRPSQCTPSPLPLQHMSYIDEVTSSSSDGEADEEELRYPQTDASTTSSAPHAFSSDSGFSSELCESSTTPARSFHMHRATRWTSSFRKLIRRVSSKRQPSSSSSHNSTT